MDRRPITNQFGHNGGGTDPKREHLVSGLQHSTGQSMPQTTSQSMPQTRSGVQYDSVPDLPNLPNLSPISAAGPNPSAYRPTWGPAEASLASFLPNYGSWTSYPTDDDPTEDASQFVQETINPASVNSAFMSSNDYFHSLSQPDSASADDGLYTSRVRSHSEHFDVLGGMAGVDFTNLAQGGLDLYTESLQQWNNKPSPDTKTYDPFGTPHVLQEQTVDTSIPTSIQDTTDTNITHFTANILREPTSKPVISENIPSARVPVVKICDAKAKSKPSYCEVAKNRPPDHRPAATKKDTLPTHSSPEIKPPLNLPEAFPDFTGIKSSKYHGKPRSSRHSKAKKRPLLEPTTIKPDSRYGLDTFEEPVQTPKTSFSDHFSASSGSTPQSRKGSTSSGTGSYCGPDDLDMPETLKPSSSNEGSADVPNDPSPPLWSELKFESKKATVNRSGINDESASVHPSVSEDRETLRQETTASKAHSAGRQDDVKRKTPSQKAEGSEIKRSRSSSCNTSEATSSMHANTSAGAKPSVFFDPRRIFNSKPKSSVKSSSTKDSGCFPPNHDFTVHAEHHHHTKSKHSEAENILNNDKPKTKQNSNINRSCYINNDLRESPTSSKKQTNSDIQRDAGASGQSEADTIQSHRGSSHSHANHNTTHPKNKSGSGPSRDDSNGATAATPEPHPGNPQSENHKPEHPKAESPSSSSRRHDHGRGAAPSKDGRGPGHSKTDTKGGGSRSESRGPCHGKSDGRGSGHTKSDSRHPGASRQDARGSARTESRGPGAHRHGSASRVDGGSHDRSDLPQRTKPGARKNQSDLDQQYVIGDLMTQMWQWTMWAAQELGYVVWNITKLTISIGLALLLMMGQYSLSTAKSIWIVIEAKVFRTPSAGSPEQPEIKPRTNFGLKENIILPSTGDDAMKRLLAEKGSDPYSILGVRADVSDEVLKKYYRRQAVLVHPDKNQTPGAEEAFKILGHAFDLVGEVEKRRQFDSQRMEAQEEEEALHKFSDLLTKLHDKMQEASNLMRCENCGGKHRRVPTDRPMYAARYCQKCDYNHPVREGDVWAESHMLGFLWNYYACMDNRVHDITEWASCQCDRFKHIQANAHNVVYRIATNANAGGRHRQQANQRGTNEADLEDFLSHLFHQTAGGNAQASGSPGSGGTFTGEGVPGYGEARSGTSTSSQSASSSSTNKKSRRKKKRH